MPRFSDIDPSEWTAVLDRLRAVVKPSPTLERAAQHVAKHLYEAFADTTALVRVYAIAKRYELPADTRAYVDGLASSSGAAPIPNDTPVLALLGTYGAEPAWCDRHLSKGHKGIPLVSGAFVDAIPMVARLLRELGIDLSWLDEAPEIATRRLLGGFNGVFYVGDAASARDAQGRRIIPAADFVAAHGIKTVFGMGGFYPDGTLVVCIVFTRETLVRAKVERLASLISMLKGETFGVVRDRKLFEARPI